MGQGESVAHILETRNSHKHFVGKNIEWNHLGYLESAEDYIKTRKLPVKNDGKI
jgi:hypothetical protein